MLKKIVIIAAFIVSPFYVFSTDTTLIPEQTQEDIVENKIDTQADNVTMTDEELERVYDKFYRAQTGKEAFGGVGLGLAIVKDIVEGHKGTIDIESEREVGTTVTIALPK